MCSSDLRGVSNAGGCEPPTSRRRGAIARRSAILLGGTAAMALSIAQPASAISINNQVAAAVGGIANYYDAGNQFPNVVSLFSGTPFTVTSAATSLDLPGSAQTADQVKPSVQKLGAIGRGASFFDPLAFQPVTAARFGTGGVNSLRGPGVINWDFGLFRKFRASERLGMEFRMEAFNFTNTPHFGNPNSNVSNMVVNQDGSIRDLGGFSTITSTSSLAREGIDERQFRLGLRLSF